MAFCTKCGEELDPYSDFCTGCGGRIKRETQTSPVAIAKGAIGRIFGDDDESVFFDDQVLPQILRIVTSASRGVTFVTPYLGLWVHLKNAMEEAIARGVTISFVVRAGESKQLRDIKWLRDHKVRVYEIPNLHAKIYFNESDVLVSSMNIYDASTLNSLEFAVLVRNEDDAQEFRAYVARMVNKVEPQSQSTLSARRTTQTAFCIRDGSRMTVNISRPLCDRCYPKWAKYRNRSYAEKYCHSCGRSAETTFSRPVCSDCYRSNPIT